MSDPALEPDLGGGGAGLDLLLRGGIVLTQDDDRRVIDPGSVGIRDDRIVAVAPDGELQATPATTVLDCTGAVVVPGLIDTHDHLFQSLLRTLGEGLTLWPWLATVMAPYANAMTQAEAVAATRLGALELVRSGVTAVLNHHYAPSDPDTTVAVADAMVEVGLRGVVARGMRGPETELGRRTGRKAVTHYGSVAEEVAVTASCMDRKPPGSRVAIWPGPVSLTFSDPALVVAAVELARGRGARWHTHCCEVRSDPEVYDEQYGLGPVAWLAREGLLGADATLAHGIWLDDDAIARLGEHGAAVAHNPTSNQHLGSGTIRLGDLRAAGVTVGLGTDGAACGHRQDMFEEMKQAVLLQRVHHLDPARATCQEALDLATREGAALLGIDAGQIVAGRLADLAVVGLGRPHTTPVHDPVVAVVSSARPSDVRTTIVAGRIVHGEGRSQVDTDEVVREAQARSVELTRRAGLGHIPSAPTRESAPQAVGS